jgi:hypothetical protein
MQIAHIMRITYIWIAATVSILTLAVVWLEVGRNFDWRDVVFAIGWGIVSTVFLSIGLRASVGRASSFHLLFAASFAEYLLVWIVLFGIPLAYIHFRHSLDIDTDWHSILVVLITITLLALLRAAKRKIRFFSIENEKN